MSTLVLLEHDRGRVRSSSLTAVTCARLLREVSGADYDLLLIGAELGEAADGLARLGARSILLAEHSDLSAPLGGRYSAVLAEAARSRGAETIIAAASTFSKDILPRAAALLDAPMLSDVTHVKAGPGGLRFRRPVYAGNAIATVEVAAEQLVLTCRPTAFDAPELQGGETPVERLRIEPSWLEDGMEFVSREERPAGRPDLTEARVVVSGGRPLRDSDTFIRVLGGLADTLGAALGATRGAVDSGIAPNDWQVGQTGKVVAPELYVACGISGAIQHLAGMKESKVIVAINKDPEAPIFQAATYGLVADLYEAVPTLTEAIRAGRRAGDE